MLNQLFEKLNFFPESVWRYLSNIWTIFFIFVVFSDFIYAGKYSYLLTPLSLVYAAILSIFVGTKEFQRWHNLYKSKQHPGEAFVIVWSILMIFIFVGMWIFNSSYRIPAEVVSTYIMVITVFALTQSSKNLYRKKRK